MYALHIYFFIVQTVSLKFKYLRMLQFGFPQPYKTSAHGARELAVPVGMLANTRTICSTLKSNGRRHRR